MPRHIQKTRATEVAKAGLLIAAIAVVDWRVDLNVSFGFLYIFPILLLGTFLSTWQILTVATVCTVLADLLDPFPFSLAVLPQDLLVFTSLAGAGLVSHQVATRRRAEAENVKRLEDESSARREAEEQLEFLIDSSPAAIVTVDFSRRVLLANPTAHRLFGMDAGGLVGADIGEFIPALARVTSSGKFVQKFRTEMQCRGRKTNGEMFLANVFFSTYQTQTGPRLAALIVDTSEDLREREESSLQQMLAGSRILAAAVSHEIRNVCGAISVIHENLTRNGALNNNKDFEALGSLVEALSRIASLELRQSSNRIEGSALDLKEVLDDLRIVAELYCAETGVELSWNIPGSLPLVWADRHGLLQVLLNLTKNSERALAKSASKTIAFSANVLADAVTIRVCDSGPGITNLDKLFQPFQKGADATGLGLYLSRAFVRSFGGELRHDPASSGCSFVIDLLRADLSDATQATEHATHATLIS